jgi:hypothetical protein
MPRVFVASAASQGGTSVCRATRGMRRVRRRPTSATWGDANGRFIDQGLGMMWRSVEPWSGFDTSLQIGEHRRQAVSGSHVTHGEPELGRGRVCLPAAPRPLCAAVAGRGR